MPLCSYACFPGGSYPGSAAANGAGGGGAAHVSVGARVSGPPGYSHEESRAKTAGTDEEEEGSTRRAVQVTRRWSCIHTPLAACRHAKCRLCRPRDRVVAVRSHSTCGLLARGGSLISWY
jgi:hypothetical protein